MCDACREEKAADEFDHNILRNAEYHGRRRVCLCCCDKGMSPKDVEKYPCDECGDRGHLKFSYEMRRAYMQSNGRTKIVCFDCTARYAELEKILRQKKSWKCKCPGVGFDRLHRTENIKCDLFETQMGQKRWPGKNNNVCKEDWQFVERMRKRRKK